MKLLPALLAALALCAAAPVALAQEGAGSGEGESAAQACLDRLDLYEAADNKTTGPAVYRAALTCVDGAPDQANLELPRLLRAAIKVHLASGDPTDRLEAGEIINYWMPRFQKLFPADGWEILSLMRSKVLVLNAQNDQDSAWTVRREALILASKEARPEQLTVAIEILEDYLAPEAGEPIDADYMTFATLHLLFVLGVEGESSDEAKAAQERLAKVRLAHPDLPVAPAATAPLTTPTAAQIAANVASVAEIRRLRDSGKRPEALAEHQRGLKAVVDTLGPVAGLAGDQYLIAASTYAAMGDLDAAELNFARALMIFELNGQKSWDTTCASLAALGNLAEKRQAWRRAVAWDDAALACYDKDKGAAFSLTRRALKALAGIYSAAPQPPDAAERGLALVNTWIPKLQGQVPADDGLLGWLWKYKGDYLSALNKPELARDARGRALEVSRQKPGAEPDQERLNLELSTLIAQDAGAAAADIDAAYLRRAKHMAELAAQVYAPDHPIAVAARGRADKLMADYGHLLAPPPARPAVTAAATPAAPTPLRPTPPAAPSAARNSSSARLAPPKGYEDLKPAQLYTFSPEAFIGDERWVIAQSKAEAISIGRDVYPWYGVWLQCMTEENAGCGSPPLELGFGWFAVAVGTQPTKSQLRSHAYYYSGAATREDAIRGALDYYKSQRGELIIQTLRVGLIAEIDWETVGGAIKKDQDAHYGLVYPMNAIKYPTYCDWQNHQTMDRNLDPDIAEGSLDADPSCKSTNLMGEKMPYPRLRPAG